MASTEKVLNEKLRAKYLEKVVDFFKSEDEEVLITGTNELCFPCVDEGGNDKFIVIKVTVPSGSRDGEAYDGYSMAQDFELKSKEKAEKAEIAAQKKAAKIAKDKAKREQIAKAKAEHEAQKAQ